MSNIRMIRPEPGLVSIPVDKAVYCENCAEISNSAWGRCGLCGSESIVELAEVISGPAGPEFPPPSAPAQMVGLAA